MGSEMCIRDRAVDMVIAQETFQAAVVVELVVFVLVVLLLQLQIIMFQLVAAAEGLQILMVPHLQAAEQVAADMAALAEAAGETLLLMVIPAQELVAAEQVLPAKVIMVVMDHQIV